MKGKVHSVIKSQDKTVLTVIFEKDIEPGTRVSMLGTKTQVKPIVGGTAVPEGCLAAVKGYFDANPGDEVFVSDVPVQKSDSAQSRIDALAVEYQEKLAEAGHPITFAKAVSIVYAGYPELIRKARQEAL